MTDKIFYGTKEFHRDARQLADILQDKIHEGNRYSGIYGIPRGGWLLAIALSYELGLPLLENVNEAPNPIICDDVVDSGATCKKYRDKGLFVAIHRKTHCETDPHIYLWDADKWIHYFWERDEGGAGDNVRRLLQYIGEDPNRSGLQETPKRLLSAYDFIFSGYKKDPKEVIKTFDETEGYDQMILIRNIELFSMCEHHMLPFFGQAHIAYIPGKNGKVIGASKLARIAEIFARRLQIQERLTHQITEVVMNELKAQGAACVIEARHLCMTMRGVQKQHSMMVTSSLRGVFMEKVAARNEFMLRIGKFNG